MGLAGDVKQQLTDIMLDPNAEDFETANQMINGLIENTTQCDYYDSGSISTFDPATDRLFELHVNIIRSLQKNFDDFYHLLTELNTLPNLICLSETRLKDTSNFRLGNLARYNIATKNSKTNAGGVAMYVYETLEYEVIQNYSINDPNCEDLWVKLRFKNSETLLVCVICRRPKTNINDFFDKLNNSLIKIAADNLNCVILGDVNIDLKTNEACGKTCSYLNMLNSNSFHNLIDLHTRITPVSRTTIDHVYSNVFKYKSVPGIVKCALTDHYPILIILKHSKRKVDQTNHYTRSLKEFNGDNFNSDLKASLDIR